MRLIDLIEILLETQAEFITHLREAGLSPDQTYYALVQSRSPASSDLTKGLRAIQTDQAAAMATLGELSECYESLGDYEICLWSHPVYRLLIEADLDLNQEISREHVDQIFDHEYNEVRNSSIEVLEGAKAASKRFRSNAYRKLGLNPMNAPSL